ncbi:MAG: hypothetical protein BJ554DRAFT_4914, partial [Olpidium bornovanus]
RGSRLNFFFPLLRRVNHQVHVGRAWPARDGRPPGGLPQAAACVSGAITLPFAAAPPEPDAGQPPGGIGFTVAFAAKFPHIFAGRPRARARAYKKARSRRCWIRRPLPPLRSARPGNWTQPRGRGGSDTTMRETVSALLQDVVLAAGCFVQAGDGITFEVNGGRGVYSTDPDRGYVLVGNTTDIQLSSRRRESGAGKSARGAHEQPDDVSSIASSLAAVSLSSAVVPAPSETRGRLPGLEKAFQTLLEVVGYPLLYPHWFRKLKIDRENAASVHGPEGLQRPPGERSALVCAGAFPSLARAAPVHANA